MPRVGQRKPTQMSSEKQQTEMERLRSDMQQMDMPTAEHLNMALCMTSALTARTPSRSYYVPATHVFKPVKRDPKKKKK
jgi:hypothetical protein